MRFRVNLDFDAALSRNDKNFKNEKYLKELEYIFFLVNKDEESTLCSKNQYSEEYLNQLSNLGFTIPNIDTQISNYINWWGTLGPFEDIKKANSKCELASWHMPLEDRVINSKSDLEESFPSFYRPDQSFSGIGNRKLLSVRDFDSLSFPGVQSRYVDVFKTFGVTYNFQTRQYFIVENLIGNKGEFKGGRVIELADLPIKFEIEKYISLLESHLPTSSLDRSVQFDNMIYREKNSLVLCPIVEINLRRTMGEVIKIVTEKLGPGTLYFGDKAHINSSSIVLSPDFVRNICYFNRS